ncbi:uncharacterized protein PRCAT00005870001 [Priceomyces carsonii]|uniref:uncharacterized protein n=1 Tax=Priceomyces carsonii TaxID=28549 RepID=UPI002EDA1396|nr:unnamed protein product [Priceomyces carsonii]
MTKERQYLVGVDVGGTNTDSVLLDVSQINCDNRGVLAWNKSSTTSDVSNGIETAIDKLFESGEFSKKDVVSVTIGTTHFINAVIEEDSARLDKVAVLRLCSSYSKSAPPFSEFLESLKEICNGYHAYLSGGYQVDGTEINSLCEEEIRQHCKQIKELGILAVAIVGIFSCMNNQQELKVAEIVRHELPEVSLVLSHELSGIGFLERENAAILNASVMNFAKKIISSFNRAIREVNINCPVLLTQNDGSVLTSKDALKTPIRTFSSGATNSMRGAAFLCSSDNTTQNQNVMVVDIGGTTTDVGMLLSSGFPRQSSTYSYVGGVRTNFSMPCVRSIGLGGGSIIREEKNSLSVGPDSVGSEILEKSILFGGNTVTATDAAVAISLKNNDFDQLSHMGDPRRISGVFSISFLELYSEKVKKMLESIIDKMRTSPDPLPVVLVGGGSFIAPECLEGASTVIRPKFYQIANAIGAALPKLSYESVKFSPISLSAERDAAIESLKEETVDKLVAKGALRDSVVFVNIASEPVPYTDRIYKFQVKAVGDVDFKRLKETMSNFESKFDEYDTSNANIVKNSLFESSKSENVEEVFDHLNYSPTVNKGKEWIITEPDLDYIVIGAYILGCGGGGDPHGSYIQLKNMVRNGTVIRVVDPEDLRKEVNNDKYKIVNVAFRGSPTVTGEKLRGNELLESVKLLSKWEGYEKPDAVFPLEIGGDNGLQGLIIGGHLNIPVLDTDLMGRAYPTMWQTLPTVFSCDSRAFSHAASCDGNGNNLLMTSAKNDMQLENISRDAYVYSGVNVGTTNNSMTIEQVNSRTVKNSTSLAWRIGKAVMIARSQCEIEDLPKRIIEAVGSSQSAKHLFTGKFIEIERKIIRGYTYGEAVLESVDDSKVTYRMPFKNENILCYKKNQDEEKVICSVPDLICVCDADTGEAVGTQDYRYGLIVFVIAISPSNLWTDTQRGIDLGGPKAFGSAFESIEYSPIGKYSVPRSVIDEYAP